MPEIIDPLMGFKFSVRTTPISVNNIETGDQIGSIDIKAGFMRISGLGLDISPFEWSEISDPVTTYKLPDEVKFTDVVFERGLTLNGNELWLWYTQVIKALNTGQPVNIRADVSIKIIPKGNPIDGGSKREFKLFSAFPRSLKISDLDARSSAVVVESMTLAHEGLQLFV